jgi:putative salt-induced outer membrane protein YdiY
MARTICGQGCFVACFAVCLAVGCLALPAHAQWSGKGALGYVMARGNTDTTALNGSVDAKDVAGNWTNLVGSSMLRAATSGVTSAYRYEGHSQSNYRLTEESYAFASLRYEHDGFSTFQHQAVLAAGYGYKFLDTPVVKLAGEIGAGDRKSEVRLTGAQETDHVGRASINYEQAINPLTKLVDAWNVESGPDDTFMTNDLGLQVKVSAKLALSVDYQVHHHSNVTQLPGTVVYKTDQLTTVNLVFSF